MQRSPRPGPRRNRRPTSRRTSVLVGALATALCAAAVPAAAALPTSALPTSALPPSAPREQAPPAVTLTGHAVLPANTSAPGPASGAHLGAGPFNGVGVPFASQPVQGFSAVLPYRADRPDGTFIALADNGYGAIENSSDFLLRAYRIRPRPRTAGDRSGGKVDVLGSVTLRDPDHKVPFPIAHEFTDRVLTGADFDVESLQRAPDGTYWIGEEFGPSLLHVGTDGVLLEAPYDAPDSVNGGELRSPQSGKLEEATALRVMNALADRARSLGGKTTLTVSPYFKDLAGIPGNPQDETRVAAPAPGIPAASSQLFDPAALLTAGFPTVPYTVDTEADMDRLLTATDPRNGNRHTIAGIISDYPDRLYARVKALRPDAIDPATGLVDRTKLDLQAHRGGRGLRPENTLGSFEAGLDNLATTLETDVAITRDGVPVLSHDPTVDAAKCRRTDGGPYEAADQVLVRDLTLRQLQSGFVCDKTLPTYPDADNDPASSPLASAFAKARGLVSPFVVPTAQQLVDFTAYYARATKSTAPVRSRNAAAVHFNIETKTNPQPEYRARTLSPELFAATVADLITRNDLVARADIQSFDFTELESLARTHPQIPLVYLWGDTPYLPGVPGADGTNVAPTVPGGTSPWLPGLRWPYRVTQQQTPARVAPSSGFEGLGISADGTTLYPTLEKTIAGQPGAAILSFDLTRKRWSSDRWYYPFHTRADAATPAVPGSAGVGFSLGELQVLPPRPGDRTVRAVVLERDNTIGQAAIDTGVKRVYELAFDPARPGSVAATREVADLEHVADPQHVAVGRVGDVGIGDGTFALPANTIESVLAESPTDLLVLNDNNYPFDAGRRAGTPADEEVVRLHLPTPVGRLAAGR